MTNPALTSSQPLLDTVPRLPYVTALLSTASAVLYMLPTQVTEFAFNTARPEALGPWFTAHLTHWNEPHFAWSVAAFALLGGLAEMQHLGRYLVALGMSLALIPMVLLTQGPAGMAFAGLSGLAVAAFFLLITTFAREELRGGDAFWALAASTLLVSFAGQFIVEFALGEGAWPVIGGQQSLTLAHLAGMAAGFFAAFFPVFPKKTHLAGVTPGREDVK